MPIILGHGREQLRLKSNICEILGRVVMRIAANVPRVKNIELAPALSGMPKTISTHSQDSVERRQVYSLLQNASFFIQKLCEG